MKAKYADTEDFDNNDAHAVYYYASNNYVTGSYPVGWGRVQFKIHSSGYLFIRLKYAHAWSSYKQII